MPLSDLVSVWDCHVSVGISSHIHIRIRVSDWEVLVTSMKKDNKISIAQSRGITVIWFVVHGQPEDNVPRLLWSLELKPPRSRIFILEDDIISANNFIFFFALSRC